MELILKKVITINNKDIDYIQVENKYLEQGMNYIKLADYFHCGKTQISLILNKSTNKDVIEKRTHSHKYADRGICTIEGCNNKAFRKHMCVKHYNQIKIHGKILTLEERKIQCKCAYCDEYETTKYFKKINNYICPKHKQQLYKHNAIMPDTIHTNPFIYHDTYADMIAIDKNGNNILVQISLDKIDLIKSHKWGMHSSGYISCRINTKSVLLHRFIMDDIPYGYVVDHINRNKLDNRNENLRIITISENQVNKGTFASNTSGVTGVTWDKSRNKWKASLNINHKCYNLGRYDSLDEAKTARIQAEIKYHTEFIPIERQQYIKKEIMIMNNEIKEVINSIATTSRRNDKETILKNNINNTLLKDILQFVYNPYIVTGLSTKKIKKKFKLMGNTSINNIIELMDYLVIHNTGSDNDIKEIQEFINLQPQELQELYTQIVTKSLKIGITAKTLNKIYGKTFIPTFDVMLAEKYFENENKVDNTEFIITTKLDGGRTVIIKENNSIKFFTRQGQPIEDMIEMYEETKQLPDNMVYDGELLYRNDKNLASKDLYRLTMKETRKDGIKKNLIFNCFDIIPLDDFKNGICNTPCIERKEKLHNLLSQFNLSTIIEVPILYKGKDKSKIIELLDKARSNDEEGVMINLSNAPYECKRTKNLLKVKKFNDADVRVLKVNEGTGRNIGKLGAITIKFTHKDKYYECDCGSGFSDEERIKYWNNPELLIDKIVTIGYFEISENQQGGVGLRFPTWKGIIRDDKNEISMY